jgi:hypothetical protein
MSEGDGASQDPDSAPSPRARAFIARRKAMAEASAAAEAGRHDRQQTQQQADYHNPLAILAGIAVLALLLLGFIFILDRFRSDPWFADCPTAQTGGCR